MTTRPRVAGDIMRPVGFVLREDDDAWTAGRRLFEGGMTGVPVLDARGRLAGIVSQSDVAAHIRESSRAASDFYTEPDRDPVPPPPPVTVGRIMSRVIVQVPADMALDEVERHMLRRRVQRVLVVEDGRPVGVIVATDLLRVR